MSQLEPVIFLLALLAGLSDVTLRLKRPHPVLLVVAGGLVAPLLLPAVVLSPDVVSCWSCRRYFSRLASTGLMQYLAF